MKLSMHGVKEVLFYLQQNIEEALLGSYGAHVHGKSKWQEHLQF